MRFTCPSFVIFLIGHFAVAKDSTFKTETFPFLDKYSIKLQNNDSISRKLSVEQINPKIATRRSMENHKVEIMTSGKQK
jgi:hypothetical protein